MENLYHQTNRQIQEVQASLGSLERARGEDANALEHHTNGKIDVIIKNCERLDVLVNKEQPTRRANAKLRVDQLKYDCQHLQAALRQIQHRRYNHSHMFSFVMTYIIYMNTPYHYLEICSA